jgi:integrase
MLYRRGKVWWFKFSFHGSLIRETAGTDSKAVARNVERARRRGLEEGVAGVKRNRPYLLRVAAAKYLALKKPAIAATSYRIEETNLRLHLIPKLGALLTSDIEASDITAYQTERVAEKAAPGTVNLEVATLRAILRRAGLWARLQPDVRPLPERDDIGRCITAEEEARLLSAALQSRSRALYPAVVLALNTGMRSGELTNLQWKHVDLDRRLLRVGKSKTVAGENRAIPLNDRTHASLTMWASQFIDRDPEHFVFPSEKYAQPKEGQAAAVYASDPTRPVGRLKEAWEAAKRRTADKKKRRPAVICRWHDLRHTFATRLLEAGVSLPKVGAIMGWSAATMARMVKRYGHLAVDSLRAEVALLDRPRIEDDWAQNRAQSAVGQEECPS